jgi:hypothetical protein
MENKQTAVDFLLHEISEIVGIIAPDAFSAALMKIRYEQAKTLEKEQIIEFANKVLYNAECSFTGRAYLEKDINEFYNETYGTPR